MIMNVFRNAAIGVLISAVAAPSFALSSLQVSSWKQATSHPIRPEIDIMSTRTLSAAETDTSARSALADSVIYTYAPPNSHQAYPIQSIPGASIVPTAYFRSLTDLSSALSSGALTGYRAVLLDLEDWSFTPISEQENIPGTYAAAQKLLAGTGITLIGSPGIKYAIQVAPYVNVLDLQIQRYEFDSAEYLAQATRLAEGVRAVAPAIKITAGVSTNPPAGVASAWTMFKAYAVAGSIVNGLWMNVPTPGPGCPTCSAYNPNAANIFFDMLGNRLT